MLRRVIVVVVGDVEQVDYVFARDGIMTGRLCASERGRALTGVRLAVRGRAPYFGEQRDESWVQR